MGKTIKTNVSLVYNNHIPLLPHAIFESSSLPPPPPTVCLSAPFSGNVSFPLRSRTILHAFVFFAHLPLRDRAVLGSVFFLFLSRLSLPFSLSLSRFLSSILSTASLFLLLFAVLHYLCVSFSFCFLLGSQRREGEGETTATAFHALSLSSLSFGRG